MDIVLRTVMLYIVILIVMRVTTRRILRSATALDLVVIFLFGGFSVPSLLTGDNSLTGAIIGISTVAGMHFGLSRLRMRYPIVGMITEGTSVQIYAPGGFDDHQMSRSRVTMQDIVAEMRQEGRRTLDDVDWSIRGHNGSITVLPK